MYSDDEIDNKETIFSEETQRQLISEQLSIDETEAEAKENPIEEYDEEQPERKKLKREMEAEALRRLEDSARTVKDFENVVKWWDRLDENRERRERYHKMLRSNDEIPLEYGASADARYFPDNLNSMLEMQNRKGEFLDIIFCCPYDIHELVSDEYISDILNELNEERKFLLFMYAIRQFSSVRIAAIKGQSDRNIRKVRGTMLKKIQKKLLTALDKKVREQLPLTLNEKEFLRNH